MSRRGLIVDGRRAVDHYLRRTDHEHACSRRCIDDEQVEERQRRRGHEACQAGWCYS
jgi:hypothetical protein